MSENTKKIILFVVSFMFVMAAYLAVYFYQIGSPVKAEWWLKNTIEKKELISKNSNGGRVVFISGSNSLFGISGDVIEKKTGMSVVNLALHANLDIDYLSYILEKNIKPGDVVIAPLEYEYYRRDSTPTTWFITNMLGWGGDYIKSMNVFDIIEMISFTNKDRIIEGVLSNGENKYSPYNDVLASAASSDFSYKPYLYTSLDKYGSMQMPYYNQGVLVKMEANQEKYKGVLSYGKSDLSFDSHAMNGISKLKKITERNGGKFYVTWPASIKSKFFNENDKQAKLFTKNIIDNLSSMKVSTLCEPFYANLDFKMFSDTMYHLNRDGSVIRSERLSDCLLNAK